MLQRKAVAVTRRDKRRDGKYSVKEAIEAIHQAFHRCNGFDPYDGSKLDPELLGEYRNEDAKAQGAAHKKRFAMLPTVDHVKAEPVADFEIVSWQTNDAKGDMPRSSSLIAAELFRSQISKDQIDVDQFLL